MILDDYCSLLLYVVESKNWTISIIVKENIMVNRQNWLIANSYCMPRSIIAEFKWLSD